MSNPLHDAAERNDVPGVKQLLAEGVDFDAKDVSAWCEVVSICEHLRAVAGGYSVRLRVLREQYAGCKEVIWFADQILPPHVLATHIAGEYRHRPQGDLIRYPIQ